MAPQSQTRSFCYVDDLVEGLVRLMAAPENFTGPVNLGNPDEFTIRELAAQVIAEVGAKVGGGGVIEERPLPADDPQQRQPNITLAREQLGWEPKVSLKEGLPKTIDFFQQLISAGV